MITALFDIDSCQNCGFTTTYTPRCLAFWHVFTQQVRETEEHAKCLLQNRVLRFSPLSDLLLEPAPVTGPAQTSVS